MSVAIILVDPRALSTYHLALYIKAEYGLTSQEAIQAVHSLRKINAPVYLRYVHSSRSGSIAVGYVRDQAQEVHDDYYRWETGNDGIVMVHQGEAPPDPWQEAHNEFNELNRRALEERDGEAAIKALELLRDKPWIMSDAAYA